MKSFDIVNMRNFPRDATVTLTTEYFQLLSLSKWKTRISYLDKVFFLDRLGQTGAAEAGVEVKVLQLVLYEKLNPSVFKNFGWRTQTPLSSLIFWRFEFQDLSVWTLVTSVVIVGALQDGRKIR